MVNLLLSSDLSFTPFLDPSRPGSHLSWDLLNESPHFELSVDYLFYHFGEWIKAWLTKSDVGCPLSDEVRRFVLPCSLCIPDFDHGVTYLCLLQLGLFYQRKQLCVSFV